MKKALLLIAISIAIGLDCNGQTSFSGKPQYTILMIENSDTIGVTTVELFPNIAPLHVANFDSLVNVHYFDSTAFHRVIPGFMIQGGDPNSRHGAISTWGFGDPSQPTVNAEFSNAKHVRGILSAARDADTNSANSQFFICVAASAWLNGEYSVYGKVISGMNFVDSVVSAPRDTNDNPLQKIEMYISYLGSNDSVPNAPLLNIPLIGSYSASTSRVLKWISVSDGILYNVEVATDSLFSTLVRNVEVGSNSYTATALTPLTKYYWRVKTNNGGHTSSYSEVWNFYVSAVGMDELFDSINKIKVLPNPSKGLFIFENIKTGSVIELVDATGKLVLKTNVKETKVQINLSSQPKGIYFYTVSHAEIQTSTGKIVLE